MGFLHAHSIFSPNMIHVQMVWTNCCRVWAYQNLFLTLLLLFLSLSLSFEYSCSPCLLKCFITTSTVNKYARRLVGSSVTFPEFISLVPVFFLSSPPCSPVWLNSCHWCLTWPLPVGEVFCECSDYLFSRIAHSYRKYLNAKDKLQQIFYNGAKFL